MWHLAEKNLQHELGLSRKKFRASVVMRDVLALDPGRTRKSLSTVAKRITQEMDDSRRQSELKSLENQGYMMREVTPDGVYIWSKAVQTLPAEQMKFA